MNFKSFIKIFFIVVLASLVILAGAYLFLSTLVKTTPANDTSNDDSLKQEETQPAEK